MARPVDPDAQYRVKPHVTNGYTYASTQPSHFDPETGKKKYRYVRWGTVDGNLKFTPGSKFFLAPPEERQRLIFPKNWDTREAEKLAGLRQPGRPAYSIYYNATAEDSTRKFHNFIGSTFAVRHLSDRICIEHGLSIIVSPKQRSKSKFKHYGQWLGTDKPPTFKEQLKAAIDSVLSKQPQDFDVFLALMSEAGFENKWGRGGVLSFRTVGQERFTRLRSSTLGDGYDLGDIRAIIKGLAPFPNSRAKPITKKVNLIIDIQEKMRDGKGAAYARWATVYNLKQMAAALQYLQENNLLVYEELAAKAETATEHFYTTGDSLKATEAAIKRNTDLKAAIVDYVRTRPIFEEYKAKKYSNKYLAEHEADIAAYRAAQATMREILQGEKLPKMDALKAEWQSLKMAKSHGYADYRTAQKNMREVIAVKANIDYLLGITGKEKNKEMER